MTATSAEPTLDRACLLIADLSGYTAYLADAEPAEAPLIAGDLIETVVSRLRGRFRLAKLEGDAAFMWAPIDQIDGSALLDSIEAAYVAFRQRLRSVAQATDCDCAACRGMPGLDLKFVAHVGDVLRHRVAGRDELAGRDVIVAHRLLKGPAAERAGASSYVLLTDAAIGALGLDGGALGLVPVVEAYAALGEVSSGLLDLGAWWNGARPGMRPEGRSGRAAGRLIARHERLLPVHPSVAWDLLTSPAGRARWEGLAIVGESIAGRRGVGTTTACVAGRLASVEEIIDWRPFEAFARRVEQPGLGRLTAVHRLSEMAAATLLEVSWFGPARGSLDLEAGARFTEAQAAALDRLVDVAARDGGEVPGRTGDGGPPRSGVVVGGP
ncbi:MAG TPA: DUF2652 domain-containing protein [Candidatus Limnocylindrales bacterium]|nr:DUF2652 domain-containing protein [Candidatus Limnocylindrales bacterium]